MAEIQPNNSSVTTTPAAGTTTDVNVTKVNGTAVSATNPLNTQPSQGGAATSATNPSPVQLSQANAAATAANPIPAQLSLAGVAVAAATPLPAQLSQGNAVLTAANPLPAQLSQAGAALTAANPAPVQISQGNAANSAANPIFAAPVQGGGAIAVANPLSVTTGVIAAPTTKGGTAAAPLAGASFCSLASNITAGTYEITVMYCISGAAEAAGANVRLSDASAGFTATDLPSNNGGVPGVVFGPFVFSGLAVTGTNTIKLTAIANATTATVYSGTIQARRIA